jgi:hypothetical protein
VIPDAPLVSDHEDFQSHQEALGFNEIYDKYKEEEEVNPASVSIATIHVQLDKSAKGCLLVPVLFKDPSGALFPATVLVNTGAMANFVHKGLI